MTNTEATKIIHTESACVRRATNGECDRKCEVCDLLMESDKIHEAYRKAIEALEKESMCNEILNDIVRCKDCKYSYGTQSRMYCGRYGYNDMIYVHEDGYCDRGMREDDDR